MTNLQNIELARSIERGTSSVPARMLESHSPAASRDRVQRMVRSPRPQLMTAVQRAEARVSVPPLHARARSVRALPAAGPPR